MATTVVMMHGMVPPIVHSRDSWSIYAEQLNHYFTANNVKDKDKQQAILLAICGATTYQLIRSLLTEEQLKTITFKRSLH